MLETVELARLGGRLDRGERVQRHHLALRTRDAEVVELIHVEPLAARHLRDDLVGQPRNGKAVDVVAAEHRGKVRADLRKVQPQRGDLLAVEHDLRLRLVVLQVQQREGEQSAGLGLVLELLAELEELARVARGRQHELHGEIRPARQRGGGQHERADARNLARTLHHVGQDLLGRAVAFAPRLRAPCRRSPRCRPPGRSVWKMWSFSGTLARTWLRKRSV